MLKVVRASCGSGKTFNVEKKLVERAQQGKRSAYLCPAHQIAEETYRRLTALSARVFYRLSPHRVAEMPGGDPLCRYAGNAEFVSAASLGVRREMCEGLGDRHSVCKYRDTCSAAGGYIGDPTAHILIAPHQLLDEALDFVGLDGLLVLDEPPTIVETTRITAERIADARFACKYLHAGPQLEVMLAAVEKGVALGATGDARAVVTAGAPGVDWDTFPAVYRALLGLDQRQPLGDALADATAHSTRKGGRPTLSPYGLTQLRNDQPFEAGERFAAGAKALAAIARALLDEDGKVPTGVIDGELAIVETNRSLFAAYNRPGPTVLLDATIDLALLEKYVAGFDPSKAVVDLEVADGAPVERRWVYCASATKKHWLDHGRPKLSHLVGPMRRAMEIVGEDSSRQVLGLITFKALVAPIEAAWSAASPEGLPDSTRAMWHVLAPWRARHGELRLLHYGALRGDNRMADADALITAGDPWPHKADAMVTAAVVGLDFDHSYRSACQAELGQAVGRLRAPRRAKQAIAVHVGAVAPEGWTQDNSKVEELEMGRPSKSAAQVRGDVMRAWRGELGLSLRGAARLLGVAPSTLSALEKEGSEQGGGCAKSATRTAHLIEALSEHPIWRAKNLGAYLKAPTPLAPIPTREGAPGCEADGSDRPMPTCVRANVVRRAIGMGHAAVPVPAAEVDALWRGEIRAA